MPRIAIKSWFRRNLLMAVALAIGGLTWLGAAGPAQAQGNPYCYYPYYNPYYCQYYPYYYPSYSYGYPYYYPYWYGWGWYGYGCGCWW